MSQLCHHRTSKSHRNSPEPVHFNWLRQKKFGTTTLVKNSHCRCSGSLKAINVAEPPGAELSWLEPKTRLKIAAVKLAFSKIFKILQFYIPSVIFYRGNYLRIVKLFPVVPYLFHPELKDEAGFGSKTNLDPEFTKNCSAPQHWRRHRLSLICLQPTVILILCKCNN